MDRATAYLHFRATDVQKAEILKRAKAEGKSLSAYLLGRALGDGSVDTRDSQAKAERVAGSTGTSAPVAEPPVDEREEFIERRVKELMPRPKLRASGARPTERTNPCTPT